MRELIHFSKSGDVNENKDSLEKSSLGQDCEDVEKEVFDIERLRKYEKDKLHELTLNEKTKKLAKACEIVSEMAMKA